jgi:hypothetical protein
MGQRYSEGFFSFQRKIKTDSASRLDGWHNVAGWNHLYRMKNRGWKLPGRWGLNWLLPLSLVLSLGSTGCRSFLREQAMKDYPVKIKLAGGVTAPTPYQEDFLYLKTLGETVFPLEDHYFPPDKRAAMEQEILGKLGQPGCSYETFRFSLRAYLAGFNSEHACVEYNPKPFVFTNLYPLRIHYVSNEVYVANVGRAYDRSLIGQKITAINDEPVSTVEQKLFGLVSEENLFTRRAALEPFGYSRPDYYCCVGLISAVTNTLKLEFANHSTVLMAPERILKLQWQPVSSIPNPVTARSSHLYECRTFPELNLAYFQFNACFDKTAILDGLHVYMKPGFRPLVRAWLGLQFQRKQPAAMLRGLYDPDRPVFKDYLASAIRDINRQGITNLIIDLRHNAGGERELGKQLIYHLTQRQDLRDWREFVYNPKVAAYYDPKRSREIRAWYVKKFGAEPSSKQLLPTPDRPFFARITDPGSPYYVAPDRPVFSGRIIVLADQNTRSAASLLTALIQDNGLAVIVGTPTANNPTGPSTMAPFKLPRSGIQVSLPVEYFERAMPSKGEILQPDYWTTDSLADNQAGRDTAFEQAFELLHLGAAISLERIGGATKCLRTLRLAGQLPGFSIKEKAVFDLEAYSSSVTFRLGKIGDSFLYHYTFGQPSKDSPWKLQKAWRTDQNGRRLEEYPVP